MVFVAGLRFAQPVAINDPAKIGRINNLYITDVMIKIRPNQSPQKVKDLIQAKIDQLHTIAAFRSVRIDVDVDPV